MTTLLAEMDWRPVALSLRVGVAATALSLALGAIAGYALASRRLPARRFLESLTLLPLVLPPTVLGYYLLLLIGRRGPIGRAWESFFGEPMVFTLKAAILAACVSTVPIVARQLAAAFATLDPEVTEAARIDGAGRWALFTQVHLPLIRGPFIAAGTIAFARAIGDFGATLMVAGNLPGRTQTASIAIYDLMNSGQDQAALVMVIVISIMCVAALAAVSSPPRTQ